MASYPTLAHVLERWMRELPGYHVLLLYPNGGAAMGKLVRLEGDLAHLEGPSTAAWVYTYAVGATCAPSAEAPLTRWAYREVEGGVWVEQG